MGNQPSKPPTDGSSPREKEKKVNRRISVQALSHGSQGKSLAADPSASTANATAQAIPQHMHKPKLQKHLHAANSPELSSKSPVSRARSHSRGSPRGEKKGNVQPPIVEVVPEPSGPMDVPSVARTPNDDFEPSSPPSSISHYTTVSQLRPPRLPLPIADVPMPDSPSLPPIKTTNEDVSVFEKDAEEEEVENNLQRKSSALSTTTQDDEEVGEELQPYAVDVGVTKSVPTKVEWRQPGEKVYVTGTFANWERKFRLHKSKSGDWLTATLQLPPGTHHLKFIVDGEMKAADDLPTAVDFTNVLVNYLEVSADDIPRPRRESERGGRAVHPHLYPPQVLPEEDERDSGPETPENEEPERKDPPEEEVPSGDFRMLIPQALIDMDLPEDDPQYLQAVNVIQDTPGPPALPLFLAKSILNGVLPMKDDSSVLTLPNHTVLNHLATSSIKNGVLATSVTTRYKRKYVTTIMYKPTIDNEG